MAFRYPKHSHSFGTGGVVTSNPSGSNDSAWAAVQDGTSLYVVGYEGLMGEWWIEKRSMTTGALDGAFGSGGIVQSDPGTVVPDYPESVASDGTNLYIAGRVGSFSIGNQWRIEKRSMSTGALVGAFGTGGAVTIHPSTGDDYPHGIVVDGSSLYVAGHDQVPGSLQWRIEKRSASTGALDASFGSSGVITSDPSNGDDDAMGLVADATSLYVYGSSSEGGSGRHWRIEKRAKSDGALVSGFNSGGVVTSARDYIRSAIIVGTDLYAAGFDVSAGGGQWRIEKRDTTTGALVASFGAAGMVLSDPSPSGEAPYGIVSDGVSLYTVGEDLSPGNQQWRIEKRFR